MRVLSDGGIGYCWFASDMHACMNARMYTDTWREEKGCGSTWCLGPETKAVFRRDDLLGLTMQGSGSPSRWPLIFSQPCSSNGSKPLGMVMADFRCPA